MGMPMLIGAGVGALGSAVTGKNPFTGALMGGALGGLGGGASSLLKGGSFLEGAGLSSLGGATANATPSLAVAGTPVSAYLAPTTGEIGMFNTFGTGANIVGNAPASLVGATGELAPNMGLVNSLGAQSVPSFSQTLANQASMLNPAGAGGLTPITEAEYQALAQTAQSDPTLWEKLKPYATINNLSGAAQIASQFQPRQPSPAPQGRVSQGQAPQGGLGQGGVEGLLAELEKQRQTQRQPISLLVG